MKVVVYTLNQNGTIPDYILDGGYLPVENGKESPQDLDLIGIATDDATQPGFESVEKVIEYINNNGITFIHPFTKEVTPVEYIAQDIWGKMENIIL